MIKKIAFALLVVAALVCGTWGYFYLQELKKPTRKPLSVLPDGCSFLIEIKDPAAFTSSLTRGNLFWDELQKIESVNRLSALFVQVDSLLEPEEQSQLFGKETVWLAFYGKGASGKYVCAFNLPDVNGHDKALQFFEEHFAAKKLSAGLYQCVLNNGGRHNFFMYADRGLFLICKEQQFLEALSKSSAEDKLENDKLFSEAYKSVGKEKGLSLFLHQPFFYRDKWNDFFAGQGGQFFSDAGEKWLAADLTAEPADIGLRGLLPDSSRISQVLLHQDVGEVDDLTEQLPYNVSLLEAVHISDYHSFCADNYGGNAGDRRNELKKYSDSLGADAQIEMENFAGEYIAHFTATINDTSFAYALVTLKDEERALNFLSGAADSVYRRADSTKIFLFERKDIFRLLSAGFFNSEYRYVAVVNENLVFSETMKALRSFIINSGGKINLAGNERVMDFLSANFNPEVNYLYYSDVYRNRGKITGFLSERLRKDAEATALFENIDALGFSVEKRRGELFFKAHAGFNAKNKMYRNTLWETLLDTELCKTPAPIINHKTGERELVCQDKNNNLYLVSNTGKILWKKNIRERIFGDPTQVDFFANGKLQMIFATESAIHLIDRNGNYVDGFPVKIKAGAAGPVTVFDYEGTKNYRYWLPLKNNTVICLNNNCKMVDGFVPVNIKAPMERPVTHFLLQQKDYFVLTDTLGNVYLTNRKGELRGAIQNKVSAHAEIYFDVVKDAATAYLCFADRKSKTLRKLSFNDKMEVILLQVEFEPTHYCFDTLQDGNARSIILCDEKQSTSFDLFGAKGASWKIKDASIDKGKALIFGTKRVYATLRKEDNVLQLVDLQSGSAIENEIKLSELPLSYELIKGKDKYLVGYFHNKLFCIRP